MKRKIRNKIRRGIEMRSILLRPFNEDIYNEVEYPHNIKAIRTGIVICGLIVLAVILIMIKWGI